MFDDDLTVTSDFSRETAVLAASGELDIFSEARLEGAIYQAISEGTPSINVDMSEVTFVDAHSLHTLVRLTDHASESGAVLTLTRPTKRFIHVREIVDDGRVLHLETD